MSCAVFLADVGLLPLRIDNGLLNGLVDRYNGIVDRYNGIVDCYNG